MSLNHQLAEQQDQERMRIRQVNHPPVLVPCDNHPQCSNQVWGKWNVCSECLRKGEKK